MLRPLFCIQDSVNPAVKNVPRGTFSNAGCEHPESNLLTQIALHDMLMTVSLKDIIFLFVSILRRIPLQLSSLSLYAQSIRKCLLQACRKPL